MAITLTAGMRNNNPGNIKYIGQAGTHASVNTDQGDPQAVYPSAQQGMNAMWQLLLRKYQGGKRTPMDIIAGKTGWTPGNTTAAQNVAKYAGIGVNDDINLTNPYHAFKFMRALMRQEHGEAALGYADDLVHGAINSGGTKPMKFPYRLEGGGRRPDAISGMQQPFNQALLAMYQAAPPEVQRELGIASGYRSYQVQKALWDASDKTGHSVARPGSSKHEHGTAADLYGFGLKNTGAVSQATKDWVHQNAGQFGLYFPMAHEPWHVQLKDTSGLRHVGGAGSSAANFGQNTLAMTGESGGGSSSSEPGGIAGLIGDELKGEDKDKPLGGLLGDLLKPEPPKMLQSNLTPPPGGGAQGMPSLPEYIQQFIATRMRGQPQPPSGGIPGTGGQGIG